MLTFTDTLMTKEKLISRLEAHAAADELIKGCYWERGKGCAVGCSIHGSRHADYETYFGIPRELARLEDVIFERLSNGASKAWPLRFTQAVPIGADLSLVWPKFAAWLLAGLPRSRREDVNEAVAGVKELYDKWIVTGVKPATGEFIKAAYAAYAAYAAAYAAYAADAAYAAAYAAYAADAAAYAAYAAYAAAYAAYAAYAAAAAAARAKFWVDASDKLVELLEAA